MLGRFTNQKTLALIAILSAIFALALTVVRVSSVFSLVEPVHNVTSGWEQESLFALWKWVNDLPVYNDPRELPFSISFYNWLYYEIYGVVTKAVLTTFSLSDDWLPTIGRTITFFGAVLGSIISYFAFLEVAGVSSTAKINTKLIAASFAGFIFFGPLVGFWVFTVRTDMWTLMLEAMAILLFWKNYQSRPVRAVLLCAVACYAAWSFKHISVFAALTVGLWLMLQRDWRALLIFTPILGAAYGGTLFLGNEEYFKSLFLTGELGFNLDLAIRNNINFILKSAPGLAVLGAILVAVIGSKPFRKILIMDSGFQFALIGFFISMILMVPGSAKDGAAENYFFLPSLFMGMLAIVAIARFEETQSQLAKSSTGSLFFGILSLGWVANFCAILIVFTGVRGVTSIKQNAKYYEQGKACVKNLPTPFYVDEFYLSLPWVNPSRPIIYPGYNYGFQRSKGYRFERGGIGGMISAGHFKALVLKGVVKEYDGADLSNFTLGPQCKDLQVYLYIPKTQ